MAVGSSAIGSVYAAGWFAGRAEAIRYAILEAAARLARFCWRRESSSRTCRSTTKTSGERIRRTLPETIRRGLTSGVIGDPNHDRGERATTMLPADEDYARALLALFAAAGTRPGESLPAGRIGHDFVERNFGRAADYEAALAHAVERGGVKIALDRLRLTPAGFAEF